MDTMKIVNNLPFEKIDENTVLLATKTARGVIYSYIHLCPERIKKASESYFLNSDEERTRKRKNRMYIKVKKWVLGKTLLLSKKLKRQS